MNQNEGQPSGKNSEWEQNREQNIAIAKRIEGLLKIQRPNRAELLIGIIKSGVENLQELNAVETIETLRDQGFVNEEDSPVIPTKVQEGLTSDDIETLSLGDTNFFSHVENKHRTLVIGVGLCDEAKDSDFLIGSMIGGLPEEFTYPVYVIEEKQDETVPDSDRKVFASTQYGELPNNMVGSDGQSYSVSNIYCFNLFGQGIKIEDIYKFDTSDLRERLSEVEGLPEEGIEWFVRGHEDAKQRYLHVNFIPEDGYRVMPLTLEDYIKVSKMLEQIDAGLYH